MPATAATVERLSQNVEGQTGSERANGGAKTNGNFKAVCGQGGRNRRNSDWFWDTWQGLVSDENGGPLAFVVNPQPYREAHFATWPARLASPMILAGCPEGGTVLDPFGGSGTSGMVAIELGRSAILCELNPEYAELARRRCAVTPGMAFGPS